MKTEIKTRVELADLVPKGGFFIELGVAAGAFAEQIMERNPSINYLGIDRWSDHHDDTEMLNAIERLRRFPKADVFRSTFHDAAGYIDDGAADLVYVDGYAHTGQEGGKTLRDWWPKVRSGGIFAGHDYATDYQPTIAAVNRFVAEHGLELNLTGEARLPSWWVRKP